MSKDLKQNPICVAIAANDVIGSSVARHDLTVPEILAEKLRGGGGPGPLKVAESVDADDIEIISAARVRVEEFPGYPAVAKILGTMMFVDGYLAALQLMKLRGHDVEALQKAKVGE